MKISLPHYIFDFSNIFNEAGFELYLVGGALRNIVAGMDPTDYDFSTNANPKQVISLFKRVIPTGIKHGTVTVLFKNRQFEVTTYRVDGKYSNSRHPDNILFTSDILMDLQRRDFTINAMAYNLNNGDFLDPHNGKDDLKRKTIMAIGNPEERFSEDGLRLMRACRFASQLNFSIDKKTVEGMIRAASYIKNVSAERIMDELVKIMKTDIPSNSFKIMRDTGLLEIVLPELKDCVDIAQKGFHQFDVFEHCIYACDAAPKNNLEVRLAALFHDIGKPAVLKIDEFNMPQFHGHERMSSKIAGKILRRFKFPRRVENKVCKLIEHHMFFYTSEWKDNAVRKFISKIGLEDLNDLVLLRMADQYGFARKHFIHDSLQDFKKRINEVLNKDNAFTIKDLAINGEELKNELKIAEGPRIGIILKELLDAVMDDPKMNNKTDLLNLSKNLNNQINIKEYV